LFVAASPLSIINNNNLVENAIRPVLSEELLFAGSHNEAKRAAMLYSFFGSM
jgi:hypothetical protein